jgi:hypothetical protein
MDASYETRSAGTGELNFIWVKHRQNATALTSPVSSANWPLPHRAMRIINPPSWREAASLFNGGNKILQL